MIEEYYFGSIIINGKIYNEDVEVHSTGEVLPWIFRERHFIDVKEVERAVGQNPKIIIIGTGESALAEVTKEAQDFIKEKGIELIIEATGEAVRNFNISAEEKEEKEGGKKVIGLFHLTC